MIFYRVGLLQFLESKSNLYHHLPKALLLSPANFHIHFHSDQGETGFPGGSVVKTGCQSSRRQYSPTVRKILWRRKRQPTPEFLPGKSRGQRSLAGYSPWHRRTVRHGLVTKTTKVKEKPHSSQTHSVVSFHSLLSVCICISVFLSLLSAARRREAWEGRCKTSLISFYYFQNNKSSHNNTRSNEETRPGKTSNLHSGCFKPQH